MDVKGPRVWTDLNWQCEYDNELSDAMIHEEFPDHLIDYQVARSTLHF